MPTKGARARQDQLGRDRPSRSGRGYMTSATAGREDWKNTILAGLANYIDAGSIVAGAAALALWVEAYRLDTSLVGLIGAFGPNAIAAGIGALIGGRLCDLFGRKKIYQYDMLFYAFRSEERRVGKEVVSTCRVRLSPYK